MLSPEKLLAFRLSQHKKYQEVASQYNNPAYTWVAQRLAEGHTLEQIQSYLLLHGYTQEQTDYLFVPFKEANPSSSQAPQQPAQKAPPQVSENDEVFQKSLEQKFNGDISPTNAREYFLKLYMLLRFPSFFFSHLYTTDTFKGIRMAGFSALMSLTIGLVFWFGYYYSNLFLLLPPVLKNIISLQLTGKLFLLFVLILFIFQPVYFLIVRARTTQLTFKQYVTGLLFSMSPFIIFSSVPFLNIIAVLFSLHLADAAFRNYLHVDERTIFDVSAIYALGLVLVSLALSILYATGAVSTESSCTFFSTETSTSSGCLAQITSWNTLTISGLPAGLSEENLLIYDKNEKLICKGESSRAIDCFNLILPGSYYFKGESMTGAFTVE